MPSPPEGPLVFSDITKRSGKVSWKHSKDNGGSPITHYIVEKREGWKTSWLPVERVEGDKLSCHLTHLQEGQEVNIRVSAKNVAGQSKYLEVDQSLIPKSPYSEYFCSSDYFVDRSCKEWYGIKLSLI